eukprot:6252343-Pyramimonas_sp.AAC.1
MSRWRRSSSSSPPPIPATSTRCSHSRRTDRWISTRYTRYTSLPFALNGLWGVECILAGIVTGGPVK